MKRIAIPAPTAGLILGLAASANLFSSLPVLQLLFVILAINFAGLLIFQVISNRSTLTKWLNDPTKHGVLCAFPMGLCYLAMLLASYAYYPALVLYVLALVLHGTLLVSFTARHVRRFALSKVSTTWFLVYTGTAAASVASPVFGLAVIGRAILVFAFVSMLILFPVLFVRYLRYPAKGAGLPLLCIFLAPLNLCLVAYKRSALSVNNDLYREGLSISIVLYAFCFVTMLYVIFYQNRGEFFPTFSAFTFPFVNAAIAFRLQFGDNLLSGILVAIALGLTIFTTAGYLRYLKTGQTQILTGGQNDRTHSQSPEPHRI